MSVSPLDLLAANAYSRRDSRTLADVLKGGQDQAIDAATANVKNQAQDIANKRSQLGLEEDESLHPLVMAQLAQEAQAKSQTTPSSAGRAGDSMVGQPSTVPNLPPPFQDFGPQPAPAKPFMLGDGAPSSSGNSGASMTGQPAAGSPSAGSSMTGQPGPGSGAPIAPNDPYTQQQSLLDEQKGLADYANGHPIALALSQRLKDIEAAKEQNLSERQGIAGKQFGLDENRAFASVLPNMEAIKNQGIKAMRDDPQALSALGVDSKQGTRNSRAQSAYNAMLGAVQSAAVSKNPYLANSETLKNYLSTLERYKPPAQPNMAVMMNQSAPKGGGAALAEQVQNGNMLPKDAVASIMGNRMLSPQAKQAELIEYSKALPEMGGKYTSPQLATFARNAADPTFNRTATAINAVTPNIDALLKLSDQYGRVNIPLLNQAIEKGDFNLGGQTITDMGQLQKIIAEEAGKVFGGSATSDFKIKLGDQMLDLSLGQKNFRSNALQLKTAMINKKRAQSEAAGPFSIWKDDPDLKPAQSGTGQVGSAKENPVDAKDRPAYDALPPGAWYKGPSGHIAQKPGAR